MLVGEQKVEVLERLPQEKGLHHVLGSGVQRVPHITDGGVAARHFGVGFDSLNNEYL